ncbi:endolytic transglycosylase MltG [Lactovum miscens]|uniref:Endolytic murein transglycosylase n=1 Tax=Lactovum miscens TaxID=190387 RepID=A0A841C949_9LACT|nr:endolytic transglycosylase MltG [Lactovum miscens]MBB5888081.1 UPF0755 protein [Lactovum miscens]
MSEEINSESLSSDFLLKEIPQSEFESSPKPVPGTPVFVERKVPDDIQLIAQQAMFEQGKVHVGGDEDNSYLTNKRPDSQKVMKSHLMVDQPIMSMDDDDFIISKKQKFENNSHSSKISKVDYLDKLPKRKTSEIENENKGISELPQNSDLLTSGLIPKSLKNNMNDVKESSSTNSQKTSDTKEYVSFKEMIMSRLYDDSEDPEDPSMKSKSQSVAITDNLSESPLPKVHTEKIKGFIQEPSEELDDFESFQTTQKSEFSDLNHTLHPESKKSRNPLEAQEPDISPALARALATRKQAHASVRSDEKIVEKSPEIKDGLSQANRVTISNEIRENPLIMSRKARNFNEETEEKKLNKVEKKEKKKSKIHIGRSIAIVLIFLLLALGGFGYTYISSNLKAVDPNNKTTHLVTIPAGTSSKNVANILKNNNLVKNPTIFNIYALIKGQTNFKSGSYNLSKSMTPLQIAQTLVKGGVTITGKVTIPEGYTLDQISTAITINAGSKDSTASPFSKDEFLKIVTDPSFISQMAAKYPKLFVNLPKADSGVKYQLEGYLFPATYEYAAGTSLKEVVEQMIKAMDKNMQPYYDQISSLNLNVNQFISLAALVEKEANTESDRKNVADVFLKRINQGMALGSNVAILYAEGKLGTNVSAKDDANIDTSMNSPFNLYTNQGTGPGPVVSPSAMSLGAVMNHTSNSYYYFIADSTGTLHFEETSAEHDADVQLYLGGN